MADDALNNPVEIQATFIDATFIPQGFSQPYRFYVINQGTDLGKVAGKANEAGQGAYDAQVTNDAQDLVLANHEDRITSAEATLVDHEQRITTAEVTLENHEERITANEAVLADHETRITQNTEDISALDARLITAEADIDTLETNSISKAVSVSQSVQATGGSFLVGNVAIPTTDKLQVSGSVNVSGSYKVAGIQVVGAQQTGWTAATGTANKGAFNADLAFSVGTTYSQAEIQAIAAALIAERQRTKALEDAMRTHGLII